MDEKTIKNLGKVYYPALAVAVIILLTQLLSYFQLIIQYGFLSELITSDALTFVNVVSYIMFFVTLIIIIFQTVSFFKKNTKLKNANFILQIVFIILIVILFFIGLLFVESEYFYGDLEVNLTLITAIQESLISVFVSMVIIAAGNAFKLLYKPANKNKNLPSLSASTERQLSSDVSEYQKPSSDVTSEQ